MKTKSLLKRAEELKKRLVPHKPIIIIRQIVEPNGDITKEIVGGNAIKLKPPFENIHDRKEQHENKITD
jgi:hypothetical protein